MIERQQNRPSKQTVKHSTPIVNSRTRLYILQETQYNTNIKKFGKKKNRREGSKIKFEIKAAFLEW